MSNVLQVVHITTSWGRKPVRILKTLKVGSGSWIDHSTIVLFVECLLKDRFLLLKILIGLIIHILTACSFLSVSSKNIFRLRTLLSVLCCPRYLYNRWCFNKTTHHKYVKWCQTPRIYIFERRNDGIRNIILYWHPRLDSFTPASSCSSPARQQRGVCKKKAGSSIIVHNPYCSIVCSTTRSCHIVAIHLTLFFSSAKRTLYQTELVEDTIPITTTTSWLSIWKLFFEFIIGVRDILTPEFLWMNKYNTTVSTVGPTS